MTQAEFNREYMHYYLGSGVYFEYNDMKWSIYYANIVDDMHFKMILKDLACLKDWEWTELQELSGNELVIDYMDLDEIFFKHPNEDYESRQAYKDYFKNLSPKQFDYLLKKGYNLFDLNWEFTIKAE